jgi:tetratricopeptide (TPR) repeat protein
VASNLRFATKRYWVRARLPVQGTATAALGGVMIYFGTQGWRCGGEAYWTARAEGQTAFSTDQAALLQKALACEPEDYLTVYNIGECYRMQSLDGGDNYAELAQKAVDFYAQGIRLNPHDAYCQLRLGMCLDWLGRHEEAEKYYTAAEARDPNGNYVVAYIGWHYVQIGDLAAARQWFIRANKLANWTNEFAKNYLFEVCEPKITQRASGQLPLSLFYNGKDN